MKGYDYFFRNTNTGEDFTVNFNYVAPDGDEKYTFDAADWIHYGSDDHGAEYAAWVWWTGDTEPHPESLYFTASSLTDEEKQLYMRNFFRKLFLGGYVLTGFSPQ